MSTLLNIQPQTIQFGAVTDILNGAFASLSGPTGFVASQPRIVVKRIQVTNTNSSGTVIFALHKGASGASASGTEVLVGAVSARATVDLPTELVLDASDFLTGTCISSGSLVVNIAASIEF